MSLYYEDVNVDDELDPVEQLPTEDKAIDFFGRDNPTNPAFGDAEAGRKQGFGGALVPGLLKIAWLTNYVGKWAGPDSNLKSIRVAFRRPDVAGNPLTLAGRVVDKRQEEGENIVELECVTLANGEPSVRANIQVNMPSKG
ncbi:MAG: MaoC family dehydratase [Dehalococcoidia bacterium]|nr:MaoC family dehydratase [Dehalococcoidia bacterium]